MSYVFIIYIYLSAFESSTSTHSHLMNCNQKFQIKYSPNVKLFAIFHKSNSICYFLCQKKLQYFPQVAHSGGAAIKRLHSCFGENNFSFPTFGRMEGYYIFKNEKEKKNTTKSIALQKYQYHLHHRSPLSHTCTAITIELQQL